MNVKDLSGTAQDGLDDDQRLKVQLVASLVLDAFQGGDWPLAKENWDNAHITDPEELLYFWKLLQPYSLERAWLKDDQRVCFDEYRNS
jgi:hypothetical protein